VVKGILLFHGFGKIMKKNEYKMELFDIFKQFAVKINLNEDLKKLINFSFKIANLPAPLNPEHWYNR